MTTQVDATNPDLVTVGVPTHWYNLAAELETPIPPHLHPGTKEPVGPEDLAALFADDVSRALGIAAPTARRHLANLVAAGRLRMSLQYGTTGRPRQEYRRPKS